MRLNARNIVFLFKMLFVLIIMFYIIHNQNTSDLTNLKMLVALSSKLILNFEVSIIYMIAKYIIGKI